MIPAANLLGFAGQEFARKVPHVLGVILETTFGALVEIILFMVLIKQGEASVPIIKAAILGSILANLLLCLGFCFFAGGIRTGRKEVHFNEAVTEVGSNLMLVAGMGLIVPAAFSAALSTAETTLQTEVVKISRATSIILLLAFFIYVFFQMKSHHGLYLEVLEGDEEKDVDKHKDLAKAKLTMTEAIFALLFALAIVSIMAVFLVNKIEYLVKERGIKDAYVHFRHICIKWILI
jgi:Ca2+:H+ antiporter